ncbi:MAG: hypothetical protein JSW05_11655 [Candidatus Thorarchaeota archaeon]|nr:MAG: hypothetical protein JSW05_11655 [Candidatus Thorarchaeota archaeon]
MPEAENDDADIKDQLADARRLLALTDIVDRYPRVITRRVTGIVYILIGGGISLATLVMFALAGALEPQPWNPLVNLLFVSVSLLITWFIAFRLIGPLTKSMPRQVTEDEYGRFFYLMWGTIGVVLAISSVILFTQDNQWLFPVIVQILLGFGQTATYYVAREGDGVFVKENLVFGIVAILSIPFMLLLTQVAYLILIIVDIGGIYLLGVYALITAERLLLESTGRG